MSSLKPWSWTSLPMPSRTVKPAGKAPRGGSVGWAGHGWPRSIVHVPIAAAKVFPDGGAGSRLGSKRQVRWALSAAAGARHVRALMCPAALAGPKGTSGCTRLWPGLHGFAEMAGSMRRILTAPAKLGEGGHSRARVPGTGGFPAPVMVAPNRGGAAPGTAHGRG